VPNDVEPPRKTSTELFASAVPLIVGVLSPVVALFAGEVIAGAAGAVVSTTIALFAPSDPAAPGLASVRVASVLVAVLLIVPPFSARELVAL
jgi:hypothetical protein